MNLIKIGAYIASKRKALGMTQLDLAKQLGMSDKSVSKWERGICLPDVSVYIQLCEILGISINEFIAGEDLDATQLPKQAEENIIVVATEGDKKRKRLQKILILLSVIYFFIISCMMIQESVRYRNCIDPVPAYSDEMMLMDAIFDDGAYVYRYDLDNSFSNIDVNLTVYRKGKVTDTCTIASCKQQDIRTAGMIAIVPGEENDIKVILTEGEGKVSSKVQLLDGVSDKETLVCTISTLSSSKDLLKGDEVELVRFTYNRDATAESDYMYLLTAVFQ